MVKYLQVFLVNCIDFSVILKSYFRFQFWNILIQPWLFAYIDSRARAAGKMSILKHCFSQFSLQITAVSFIFPTARQNSILIYSSVFIDIFFNSVSARPIFKNSINLRLRFFNFRQVPSGWMVKPTQSGSEAHSSEHWAAVWIFL